MASLRISLLTPGAPRFGRPCAPARSSVPCRPRGWVGDLRESCRQSLTALSASRSFLLSPVSLFQNASVVSQDLSQYGGRSAQLKVVRAGASRGVLRSPVGHPWQQRTLVSLCGDNASSVDGTTSASLAVMKTRVVRALHMPFPWTEAHLKQPVRRHLLKRGCVCTQPSSLPCSRGGPHESAPSLCAGERRLAHGFSLWWPGALFAVGRLSVPYRPLLASSARLCLLRESRLHCALKELRPSQFQRLGLRAHREGPATGAPFVSLLLFSMGSRSCLRFLEHPKGAGASRNNLGAGGT